MPHTISSVFMVCMSVLGFYYSLLPMIHMTQCGCCAKTANGPLMCFVFADGRRLGPIMSAWHNFHFENILCIGKLNYIILLLLYCCVMCVVRVLFKFWFGNNTRTVISYTNK